MFYLVFKLIHIAAVIIFLGNIITGLFWKAQADRTKNPPVILNALEGLSRSDRWFTIPSVIVIVIGGFSSALIGRIPILGTGWIFWSIVLLTLSSLAFSLRVAPLQKQMLALIQQGLAQEQVDWPGYHKLSHSWELWGLAALITPVGALILMVLKPALPGL